MNWLYVTSFPCPSSLFVIISGFLFMFSCFSFFSTHLIIVHVFLVFFPLLEFSLFLFRFVLSCSIQSSLYSIQSNLAITPPIPLYTSPIHVPIWLVSTPPSSPLPPSRVVSQSLFTLLYSRASMISPSFA